jgi:predicted transcriptional regulator
MSRKPFRSRQPVPGEGDAERISFMISAADRAAVERIAEAKRVSIAWVAREAVSRYLALPENQEFTQSPEG